MKKFFYPYYLLKISVLLLLFFSQGIVYGQTATVSPPLGGFKIDGALRANVTIQAGDWVPRLNSQTFATPPDLDSFVLDKDGIAKNTTTTKMKRDLFNSTVDNVFTQGSKFNDYLSALHWGLSGAPNKNDIHNGLFHASGDASGNQWVFIAGDRLDVSGTSYIDFEFLQGTITQTATSFTGSGTAGGRTIGDINISMEYNNGGTAPKVVIYRWAPTNEAGTAWAWDSTGSSLITEAYAKTNLTTVDVPFGAFNLFTYQPYAFVEAAINVTQLISTGTGGNCAGLSIKTLWIKTKASSSSTAALKDFMDPITLDLTFGGVSINAAGPYCVSASPVQLTGSPSGGTFSGTGVSSTGLFSPSVAGVGTHTIVYTATAGVNCTKTASTDIIVRALPTASVSGTTSVCKDAAQPFVVFTGSGGTRPYTFSYTINGGGTLTRTTTGTFDTARVYVPTGTAGTFTYALTGVSDANCSNTASGNAVVTVNPKPSASIAGTTTVCKDATSPFVVITGSGGTRPYTFNYTLNGSPLQRTTTGTFDTVRIIVPTGTAGTFTYALTGVSDANCSNTASGSAVVTVNPKPSASLTGTTTVCKDATQPFVVFTGSGGTRPYTFNYTLNGSPLQRTTTGSFDTARVYVPTGTPGTYTYVLTGVSDANCSNTASGTATVTVNDIPSAPTICITQPTLCGPATGSITVLSPTGAGYEYSKDGGTTWQTSPTFSNLAAGSNPSIVYKTALGCVSAPATCGSGSICEAPSGRLNTNTVTQQETVEQKTEEPVAKPLGSATINSVNTSSVTVSAMPNPFSDKVRFMITNPEAGSGTLDIYNMAGQKIKTVYQGYVPAGTSYFDLTLATTKSASLIYVLKIGDQRLTGKLVQLNSSKN